MEDIEVVNNNAKIPINATKIISKYKNIKDRMNFCFEKNWYHPNEIGFDANFFLKVLMGEKKYLPNNFTVNYKMHFFRKGEKLDKSYLIQKMSNNPKYAEYTPDIKDAKKFSKDFLLLLFAYIDPKLYKEIYEVNKKQISERVFNKWGDYKIDIQKDLINDIENFLPMNSKANSKGGFRTTKNHRPTGTFYKFQNIREADNNNESNNMIIQNEMQKLQEYNRENQKKNQQLYEENKLLSHNSEKMENIVKANFEKIKQYEQILINQGIMDQMDNKHDNIDNKSLEINLKNAPNKVKKAIDNK